MGAPVTVMVSVFAAFALWGLINFCWFVAGKTNNRLSGWVAYTAITALPAFAVVTSLWALARVLWARTQ